jgi:hypothetical protein
MVKIYNMEGIIMLVSANYAFKSSSVINLNHKQKKQKVSFGSEVTKADKETYTKYKDLFLLMAQNNWNQEQLGQKVNAIKDSVKQERKPMLTKQLYTDIENTPLDVLTTLCDIKKQNYNSPTNELGEPYEYEQLIPELGYKKIKNEVLASIAQNHKKIIEVKDVQECEEEISSELPTWYYNEFSYKNLIRLKEGLLNICDSKEDLQILLPLLSPENKYDLPISHIQINGTYSYYIGEGELHSNKGPIDIQKYLVKPLLEKVGVTMQDLT